MKAILFILIVFAFLSLFPTPYYQKTTVCTNEDICTTVSGIKWGSSMFDQLVNQD